MSWKTITTHIVELPLNSAALDAAIALASAQDAHLDIICLGVDYTQPEVYYSGAHAMTLPSSMTRAEEAATELEAAVRERMKSETIRWSVLALTTPIVGVSAAVADAARFSDLVVAAKPYGKGRGHVDEAIIEAAMFGGGAPVLVVPNKQVPTLFRKICVAWNDSPEALRAVRATTGLMLEAGAANIVIIDPPQHGAGRSDPGGQLSEMLARHGIRAEVSILAKTMPTVADVLERHLADCGADLLIMGAYGHSRLREAILGGATRDMLAQTDIPVLMVH